jgi:hypothetical protein
VSDYSPVYSGGVTPLSLTASAAITGGQVLEVTATGTVGPATAATTKPVGVAGNDTASGGRVTVWPLANCIHEITVVAAATVTAADGVITGTAGTVNTVVVATGAAAGTLIGTALTTATAPNKVRFIGRG